MARVVPAPGKAPIRRRLSMRRVTALRRHRQAL